MATLGTQDAGVNFVQTVDSGGQAIRYWLPASFGASTPLVMIFHPQGQSEQITPGYFLYPVVHTFVQAGYMVVALNAHGVSNWGNDNSLTDVANAYTFMNALHPVSSVLLLGSSMGAVLVALAVAKATLPAGKVKAAVTIDGALSLSAMYASATYTATIDTGYGITRGTLSGATIVGATSLPTTSSFPTIGTQLLVGNGTANVETVTTTGASNGASVAVTAFTKSHASGDQVSDYPTKTATHDPVLFAGSAFGSLPWRFYASSADVTVDKTLNTDPFRAIVAALATESVVVSHANAHLATNAAQPRDVLAYARRYLT